MYGREYGGKELRFEASGGLIHFSLVMQDKETDSYWSIMSGESLAGELAGTRLEELPLGEKVQWKDWVRKHPDTLVLSVDGVEHQPLSANYERYFASERGPGGSQAEDTRLETKAPIYAFQLDGRAYAVPFERFERGATFDVGKRRILLYRPVGAPLFRSSAAFVATVGGFVKRDGAWHHAASGARFDPRTAGFEGDPVERLDGFDTFWFHWSMNHPGTKILKAENPQPEDE